ncbi:MAG: hypothetical protein JWN25_365 [Verrucomicrobiales bacterium]|nr:hypothetical protein [Verrucomicrobiales bacterium]
MNSSTPAKERKAANVLTVLLGLFLGLSLCKFGNPVILDRMVETPSTLAGWLTGSWPVHLGFFIGTFLCLVALLLRIRGLQKVAPASFLLLGWLGWTGVSMAMSAYPELSRITFVHFAMVTLCFFTGFVWLSQQTRPGLLLCGLGAGFEVMISSGWDQHFGGLEATRRYFEIYLKPTMKDVPTDFLAKMETNRIFGTLFYPNSFAGAILLLLPALIWMTWKFGARFNRTVQATLVTVIGGPALLCLYWSGSKAGWLILLGMAVVLAIHLRISPRTKRMLLAVVLVAGLSGFVVKNLKFLQKGATSVTARSVYWKAAVEIAFKHPLLGTGPGTFSKPYSTIKPPGAEMARLVHNDYLEQASDSGWAAFLLFTSFVAISLRRCYKGIAEDPFSLEGFLLLGLGGWFAHCAVDFHLYIPALAWPAFLILGFLWGKESTRIAGNFKVQAK